MVRHGKQVYLNEEVYKLVMSFPLGKLGLNYRLCYLCGLSKARISERDIEKAGKDLEDLRKKVLEKKEV